MDARLLLLYCKYIFKSEDWQHVSLPSIQTDASLQHVAATTLSHHAEDIQGRIFFKQWLSSCHLYANL